MRPNSSSLSRISIRNNDVEIQVVSRSDTKIRVTKFRPNGTVQSEEIVETRADEEKSVAKHIKLQVALLAVESANLVNAAYEFIKHLKHIIV